MLRRIHSILYRNASLSIPLTLPLALADGSVNKHTLDKEKYKISGDKPGSGNTENIGSFKTNKMEYLINGEGPFSELGVDVYEDYWTGYKKYRGEDSYTSLDGYFEVHEDRGDNVQELKRVYEYWKRTHK